jgi:hypothetical protein
MVEAVRDGRMWWRGGGLHSQRVCGPYPIIQVQTYVTIWKWLDHGSMELLSNTQFGNSRWFWPLPMCRDAWPFATCSRGHRGLQYTRAGTLVRPGEFGHAYRMYSMSEKPGATAPRSLPGLRGESDPGTLSYTG